MSMASLAAQHDADDRCAARLPVDDGFDAFIRGVAARVIQHHLRKCTRPQRRGLSERAPALVCFIWSPATQHALRMHLYAR